MSITMFEYRQAVAGRTPFAPGDTYLLTSDGDCMCLECGYVNRRDIIRAIAGGLSDGWRIDAVCNTYNEEPGQCCAICDSDIGDQGDNLTAEDIAHLEAEVARRREDNMRDPSDPEYDKGGPEPVMTSLGYVDIWVDGDVICNGTTIHTIE